ncbi:MAG: hypothetical protein QHG99_04970 [Methanomicrobiales archaeon]|nr:hypothetical protein [Methanomicrobiales archaeon]
MGRTRSHPAPAGGEEVSGARRYAETLLRQIPQRVPRRGRITLLLIRIIDGNGSRHFDYLRGMEAKGEGPSNELADFRVSRMVVGRSMHGMRHVRIVYLRGLYANVDTLNTLRDGDADLPTGDPKILKPDQYPGGGD